MTIVLAVTIGCLYAAGTYMMLRRSLFKLILGLVLIAHGANLLIFVAGKPSGAQPPIVAPGASQPPAGFADPLPQALILTAIVISFGVLAFALVLFHRTYQTVGTDDSDDLRVDEV
ncbi:MAG TPA: Na+/H+ antiporter subunit C [Pirellulaceae bacterium]|nr:Na+/H+ antiporter subunit C [Pirellulaceae bacterium]